MGSAARLRLFINRNRPLILDGGLATELEEHGAQIQVKVTKCDIITMGRSNVFEYQVH